jgi:hypothetical protein
MRYATWTEVEKGRHAPLLTRNGVDTLLGALVSAVICGVAGLVIWSLASQATWLTLLAVGR